MGRRHRRYGNNAFDLGFWLIVWLIIVGIASLVWLSKLPSTIACSWGEKTWNECNREAKNESKDQSIEFVSENFETVKKGAKQIKKETKEN